MQKEVRMHYIVGMSQNLYEIREIGVKEVCSSSFVCINRRFTMPPVNAINPHNAYTVSLLERIPFDSLFEKLHAPECRSCESESR
jgi:hypothetical protein